jgi:hypothetical protein
MNVTDLPQLGGRRKPPCNDQFDCSRLLRWPTSIASLRLAIIATLLFWNWSVSLYRFCNDAEVSHQFMRRRFYRQLSTRIKLDLANVQRMIPVSR